MKNGIHPDYHSITISCACGNNFQAGSTLKDDLRVEICALCHPLYTGKAKLVDTAGRVEKFQSRQQNALKAQELAKARAAAKVEREIERQKLEAEIEAHKEANRSKSGTK